MILHNGHIAENMDGVFQKLDAISKQFDAIKKRLGTILLSVNLGRITTMASMPCLQSLINSPGGLTRDFNTWR